MAQGFLHALGRFTPQPQSFGQQFQEGLQTGQSIQDLIAQSRLKSGVGQLLQETPTPTSAQIAQTVGQVDPLKALPFAQQAAKEQQTQQANQQKAMEFKQGATDLFGKQIEVLAKSGVDQETLKTSLNSYISDLNSSFGTNIGQIKNLELDVATTGGLSEFTQKEIIKAQAKGAKHATEEQLEKLPEAAFIRFGKGDKQVNLVRPAKQLSTEASGKLSTARSAAVGISNILNDIESGKLTMLDFKAAATPVAKRLGSTAQILNAKLQLMSEGLGRVLSGAAVPDHEIKAFNRLFAVESLDTMETIKFKLERSEKIVEDLENFIRFGGTERAFVKKELKKAGLKSEGNKVVPIKKESKPKTIIQTQPDGTKVEVTVGPDGKAISFRKLLP